MLLFWRTQKRRKEKEETYFFKLSKYQKQLEEYIERLEKNVPIVCGNWNPNEYVDKFHFNKYMLLVRMVEGWKRVQAV
mgnify:CR=1 FL=1